MDAGPDEPLFTLSFCGQHDQLLSEYQNALEAWAKVREESWHLGLRGKELNGELLRLQGEFASSYAMLHKHSRECLLCRLGGKLSNHDSGRLSFTSPRSLPD
jgi:hypothetical protein